MIPQSFVQELLNRVDIVDVVERHVPLKRAGTNYAACCPFHGEKTPSFTVSPAKQFYHCFGCGAHGTAIGFLMEHLGMSFPEAVKELAARVGMTVPEDRSAAPAPKTVGLHDVLLKAAKFYREQLKGSEKAVAYLKRRGLTGDVAARFGLGYAPAGWQALAAAFPDYQARLLVDAGLVIQGEDGKRYDRFRDRVMFPILNQR
ncbi:MAG TPA: CHC2 zinc finger domain-containing protein, partial [Burkholderiales bacterium]|nr:CHC2 zinc finger domain-containing protein [Burkholderiales bacterium]